MNPLDSNIQANSLMAGQGKLQQLQQQYLHPSTRDQKKLKESAQEFESIFVQQMLDQMDKTIDRENSFLSGGSSEGYWRSMLNQEIAKSMTSRTGGSGFGLAESIYKQMAASMKSDAAGTENGSGTTSEVQPQ